MKQNELLKNLKEHISKTAEDIDPQKTAGAIYFICKQNSVSSLKGTTYSKMLKEIKSYLRDDFNWNWNEIHACFCYLNKLLR